MKELILIFMLLTIPILAQNSDKGNSLKGDNILYNSFEKTPQALRTIPANDIYNYADSVSYGYGTPDSVATIHLIPASFWLFSLKDTGVVVASGGISDSVKIEYYDSLNGSWGLVGVKSLVDGTSYSDAISPGSSYTRGYWFYTPVPFGTIRVSLINYRAEYPTRKTWFTLRALR